MRAMTAPKAKTLALLACVALGGTLGSLPAAASEADLIKRIEALQKEIETLKGEVKKVQKDAKEAAKPAATAPVQQAEVQGWRKYFSDMPKGEAPATSARTGITVYGRIDLGYERNDDGLVNRTVLNSYSSRIGFKGTRVLSDDLTGVMQVETGIAPDDNANAGTWGSRETYAGLRSKRFGTVKAGKHDSPFKDLEGEAAPMWGQGEAMEVIIHGKGTKVAAGSSFENLHTRFNNTVQYETPKFGAFQVKAAYATDEVNGATGTVKKPAAAASAEWNTGMWYAGLAWQNTQNFNGQGKDMKGLKAAGSVKWADYTVGAMWSKLENGLGKQTKNWLVSGTAKLGPTVLKANYAKSGETAGGADDGIAMYAVELDWPIDKHTAVYWYYAKIKNDRNARGRFAAGENTYSPVAGEDPAVTAIALRYNF